MKRYTRKQFIADMNRLGACGPAMRWVKHTPGSPQQLWNKCRKWAWLDWWAGEVAYRQSDSGDRTALDYYMEYYTSVDTDTLASIRKHYPKIPRPK